MTYSRVKRESYGPFTTSAAASTAVNHGVITEIEGVPLDEFDNLMIVMDVTAASVGGPWDVYLQMPRVVDPISTTDAHWNDFGHPAQTPAASLQDQVGILPAAPLANTADIAQTNAWRITEQQTLPADAALALDFVPEQLRIMSLTGAAVTGAATFSLIITGSRPIKQ